MLNKSVYSFLYFSIETLVQNTLSSIITFTQFVECTLPVDQEKDYCVTKETRSVNHSVTPNSGYTGLEILFRFDVGFGYNGSFYLPPIMS